MGKNRSTDVLPSNILDWVRNIVSHANDEVSRAMTMQPNTYEETLDQLFVSSMNGVPSTLFPDSGIALAIDTHWLGGRALWGRWEIADIALVAVFRQNGTLVWRKVALLQSKRLYSNEIDVSELDDFDYRVGIGRLIDVTDPKVPLFAQRAFSFRRDSAYRQLQPRSEQVVRIDQYRATRGIPVFYSLYNPVRIPFEGIIPMVDGLSLDLSNDVGCRVISSEVIHGIILKTLGSPTFEQINVSTENCSYHGWRVEEFIADQFLNCREGRRIDDADDPNLMALLYERSGPISGAIVITVDYPAEYELQME